MIPEKTEPLRSRWRAASSQEAEMENVLIKKCLAFFRSGGLLVRGEAWLLSLVVLEGVHSRDLSFFKNDYY